MGLPAPDAQLPANPFELLSGLGDVQPCQSGGRRNVLRLDLGVPQQHLAEFREPFEGPDQQATVLP